VKNSYACNNQFQLSSGASLAWSLSLILSFVIAISAHRICAQESGTPSSPAAGSQASPAPAISDESRKQPTDAFRLSKEQYDKAVAYSRAGYTLHFVSTAWGILVLVALLGWGVVAKIRDVAVKGSRNPSVQAIVFVGVLSVVTGVLHLPLSMYWHRLSLRYEQSVQGWGSWLWDWTKGELIGIVLGSIVALILYLVIRWKPRTWWLYFWFASIPLLLALVLVAPWVFDPMFNKFTPLGEKHTELVQSIEQLTQKAGMPIPRERMFLMEASAKTNQINAYVTGLGASKRVVVWDNTIKKMAPDEVLFVVGHELGHYALDHVFKGIVFGLAGIFVALYIVYRALRWVLARWGVTWGVPSQQDWSALVVILLIFNVIAFFAEPIGNSFSRSQEHAADVYGLEVTHGIIPNSNEAAAHAFQVMGELDLADPNPSPIITIWLYGHPPLAERLEFAHNYNPWGKGESPKYVK
jgi:Zn-dependent protease with chaperone function